MSKLREWLDKWIDEHDLGGITVGQIKAEFAAIERERDEEKHDAQRWKEACASHILARQAAEKCGVSREKLEALAKDLDRGLLAGYAERVRAIARALLADNAKEGDPLMVHQLEQARRNWRYWQERAEIVEEQLASRHAPAAPDALREALIRSDSLLSLVRHRHRVTEIPREVVADIDDCIRQSRAALLADLPRAEAAALSPRKEGEG